MGHSSVQIRVLIKKFPVMSIRFFYRSVCNHPFLVGLVCFLMLLYRSFPFLLSLLITASPVLVCTAILLGTLLSFGQANIPEIEKEEKVVTHEIASLRAGVSQDATIVERDVSFTTERFAGMRADIIEKAIEQSSSVENKPRQIEKAYDSSVNNVPLVDEKPQKNECEKQVIEEDKRDLHDSELEKKREIHEEKLETEGMASDGEEVVNHYTLVGEERDENLEVETDRSPGESVGSHARERLDSEEDDVGDEKSSDDESDQAESSSPDASMADIIPMLDELHPLLDEDAPQPAHMSHDNSDAASERSSGSNNDIIESDEDSENNGEEVDGDDDNDDEDEEAAPGDKGDASTSAIIWTEDDHKNVMDLGTSEIERNQRLESLIARRRARKNISMLTEKDLIDLDGIDLPFNVPPIATTRRNPFDVPDDSYDHLGLLPIPGSAPSILLPRRNPFDIPYDSSEEKPDLKGDSFEQEFAGFQQKETSFFRRHESFSWGPSTLGGPKQERQEIKWRPYFVPERLASEGSSYPSFQRQLSEVSDAKTSSVPDTESVSSAVDQDDEKLNDEDHSREREVMSTIDHASDHVGHESQSSEDVDSVDIEEIEQRDTNHDEVEISLGDLEIHPISEAGERATPVELNLGEIHMKPGPVEELYSSRSSSSSLSEVSEVATDVNKGAANLEPKGILTEESGISKQPSPEESELLSVVLDDSHQHKEPVYDSSPPTIEKFLSFSSISSETASPPASVETTVPFTDKESEMQMENRAKDIPGNDVISEASSHVHAADENESRSKEVIEVSEHDAMKVGRAKVETESENSNESMAPESTAERVLIYSSFPSEIGSVEGSKEETFSNELDRLPSSNMDSGIHVAVHQNVDQKFDDAISSHQMPSEDLVLTVQEEQQPPVVVEHVSAVHPHLSFSEAGPVEQQALDKVKTLHSVQDQVYSSSCLDNTSEEERTNEDAYFQHEQDEFHSPTFDADVHENLDTVVVEQVSMVSPSSLDTDHVEEHSMNKEETLLFEQEEDHSSSNEANTSAGLHHELDVKVVSQSSHQHAPSEENCPSELEKQPTWSDKSMVEPSFDDDHGLQGPSIVQRELMDEVGIDDNVAVPEIHDAEEKVSPGLSSLNPDSEILEFNLEVWKEAVVDETDDENQVQTSGHVNSSSIAYGSHISEANINVEADEIKEIDEGLLSELDRVGDFSINEVEALHAEMIQERSEVRSAEFEPLDNELNAIETKLPAIEARSVEDIDLAFKQLHEGVDVEEVILPSSFKDGPDMENSTDSKLELPAIEARSVKVIILPSSFKDGPDMENSTDSKLELPAIEARSAEDIDLAFKQLHEGVDVEEVILPSSFKDGPDMDHSVDSNLQVMDARSVEDIHSVLNQVSQVNSEKPLELDSKDGSAEVKADEVSSTKDLDLARVKPSVKDTSAVGLDKPLDGHHEASDGSSLSISDTKGKKERPHQSSSSSSSSSSDSE